MGLALPKAVALTPHAGVQCFPAPACSCSSGAARAVCAVHASEARVCACELKLALAVSPEDCKQFNACRGHQARIACSHDCACIQDSNQDSAPADDGLSDTTHLLWLHDNHCHGNMPMMACSSPHDNACMQSTSNFIVQHTAGHVQEACRFCRANLAEASSLACDTSRWCKLSLLTHLDFCFRVARIVEALRGQGLRQQVFKIKLKVHVIQIIIFWQLDLISSQRLQATVQSLKFAAIRWSITPDVQVNT